MKILVFMSDNRPLDPNPETQEYNSVVAAINAAYCKQHGYDFLYYQPYLRVKEPLCLYNCLDPTTKEPRHASWSKLLSTKLALDLHYDYIMYIDSDCIFKRFDLRIESFLEPYLEKSILFWSNKPWSTSHPCAGVYLCKVCDQTKDLIKSWYNYSIPAHNTQHMYEQNALWQFFGELNMAIIDDTMFSEVDGQFLRHIGIDVHYQRLPYFKRFHEEKGISYSESIQTIQVVQFDTEHGILVSAI
jgi:hypothetical protein